MHNISICIYYTNIHVCRQFVGYICNTISFFHPVCVRNWGRSHQSITPATWRPTGHSVESPRFGLPCVGPLWKNRWDIWVENPRPVTKCATVSTHVHLTPFTYCTGQRGAETHRWRDSLQREKSIDSIPSFFGKCHHMMPQLHRGILESNIQRMTLSPTTVHQTNLLMEMKATKASNDFSSTWLGKSSYDTVQVKSGHADICWIN